MTMSLRSHQFGGVYLWGFMPKAVSKRPEARQQCVTTMTCKKTKQILLASQPLRSSSSKCFNNVLIPSHFKPVCLSEDICSIFGNENKVSARFNLFLSQIFSSHSPRPPQLALLAYWASLPLTESQRPTICTAVARSQHTLKINSNLHLIAFPQSWTLGSS